MLRNVTKMAHFSCKSEDFKTNFESSSVLFLQSCISKTKKVN